MKLKRNNWFEKSLMICLLLSLLFLTGCVDVGSGDRLGTKDQYIGGFVIHNPKDSPSINVLNHDGDYEELNFYHDFPGRAPDNYQGVYYFRMPYIADRYKTLTIGAPSNHDKNSVLHSLHHD
jgi:hypothetical protein